jgi:hypothetical protein
MTTTEPVKVHPEYLVRFTGARAAQTLHHGIVRDRSVIARCQKFADQPHMVEVVREVPLDGVNTQTVRSGMTAAELAHGCLKCFTAARSRVATRSV